jgi:hypothetical protein
MFCKQCGAQLAPGINFCTTCGQAVTIEAPAPTDVSQPTPAPATSDPFAPSYNFDAFEPESPRGPKKGSVKWIAIGAAALVAILVTVVGISAAEDAKYLKPDSAPALADSLSATKVDAAAQAKCIDLASTLPSDATVKALISRSLVMNKYTAGAARRANKFLNATAWINSTELPDIRASMDEVLAGGLDEVIAKTAAIRESDRQAFADMWTEEFKNLAIEKCGLTERLAAATAAEAGFKSAKDSLETLAASVPWYPDGFNEWSEDSNIAWKWVDGYNCNLGDWCWHIKVIAASGCPDGVYAEMNILDSADNVVDYSNDTVPRLGAGASAILEFSTYNSTHAAGQMATITCHGD